MNDRPYGSEAHARQDAAYDPEQPALATHHLDYSAGQPPYANAYKQAELPAAHPLRVMGDMLGGAAHRLTPEQLHKVSIALAVDPGAPAPAPAPAQPAGPAPLPSAADLRELKRRGQLRETYAKKLAEALTALPGDLKGRTADDNIKALAHWMLGHAAYSTLQRLRKTQLDKEQELHGERQDLVARIEEERQALDGAGAAAFEAMSQARLLDLDKKIIRAIDQLVVQTQHALQEAGAPGFAVSNAPDDIRLQMALLAAMVDILNVK